LAEWAVKRYKSHRRRPEKAEKIVEEYEIENRN